MMSNDFKVSVKSTNILPKYFKRRRFDKYSQFDKHNCIDFHRVHCNEPTPLLLDNIYCLPSISSKFFSSNCECNRPQFFM